MVTVRRHQFNKDSLSPLQSEHRPAESAAPDAGASQPELPAYIPGIPTEAHGPAAASSRGFGSAASFPSPGGGGFASAGGGGGGFTWGGDSRKRRLDDAFGRAVMEGDAGAGHQPSHMISPAKQPRLSLPLPLPALDGAAGWSETDKVWYM